MNNSGTSESTPLGSITEESFNKIFKVNVLGVLLTTQAAAKHLKEGGSVINIGSSITGMTPPTMALYVGSKAAVESITKVLSKELGPKRIRVNCVLPGTTETSAGGRWAVRGWHLPAQRSTRQWALCDAAMAA